MARRIIPINDWAPAQEAMFTSPFDGDEPAPARRHHRLPSFSAHAHGSPAAESRTRPVSLWRSRSKSAAPAPRPRFHDGQPADGGDDDDDADADGFEYPRHRSSSSSRHDGARVRTMFRRASLSIRGFVSRRMSVSAEKTIFEDDRSAAADARPGSSHSAWNRLCQAASFRHSRTSYGPGSSDDAGEPSSFAAAAAGPDLAGNKWPFIPECENAADDWPFGAEHAGAAAKASAAVANEYLALSASRQNISLASALNKWLVAAGGDDCESGIGIAAAGPEPAGPEASADAVAPADQDVAISRIDFVAELPCELAIQILAHLDSGTLRTVARVSRTWQLLSASRHVWRDSFLGLKTATFATGAPIGPGAGLGIPRVVPGIDWKRIYRAREELDARWQRGRMVPVYLNGHKDSIYCLQFDEHKIITGSRDKTIRVWDMHTYACKLVIGPPEVLDGTNILLDDELRPVHYTLLDNGRRTAESMPALASFPMHHNASILCLQYDDRILVTGSSDATCIVYDLWAGCRPVRRLRHHSGAVLDLAFDGRHIVTCSKDSSICVWDRRSGRMLRQLHGHSGPVNAVQLRGNTIVSCSGDFRVKMWNIDTGKNIREFVGHTKGLACSQFSEDGRYVASAGNDKAIRIWDANTGDCVRELRAHDGLVRSLHIDSVSGRLVSGSYDTDIKVFDMETGLQLLEFPKWHQSWVLGAKSDYRRIVSTGQDPKILVMDFGAGVDGIDALETAPRPHEQADFVARLAPGGSSPSLSLSPRRGGHACL